MKTGADHLRALRDGRTIVVDGQIVTDHVEHPAFRRAIRTGASLYDFNARPDQIELMSFASPTSGDRVSRAWQLPRNYDELVERRKALEAWATLTCGWVGRTPDTVASTLSAMFMGIELLERHSVERASAFREYFAWARDHDVWGSYAIVPPQTERTKADTGGARSFVNAGVCDEDHEGITIKGTRMLATAAPLAQELFVAAVQPLKPGEERHSFTAMVPLNAKGLKLFSRRSYEQAASSEFDYPLSSRFDEGDCIVYFDEVKIPWERVFIHKDVKMAQAQWFQTPIMVYQNYPAQIRLTVKLRFLLGLAYRIAEANGIAPFPAVQETLGQLAAEVNMVEGMVRAMEVCGKQYGPYFIPDPSLQYSAMVLTQQLYNGFTARIREIGGGGLIAMPSSEKDLSDPVIRSYIEMIQGSESLDASGRVKLFKLGWDALGSEFAGRHAQYEMFYAGPTVGNRLRNFRSYDWGSATKLVDDMLATIEAPRVN